MTATFRTAEAFSPSEYLREELEARGWTEVEFAQILNRPPQVISEIMNDRKEITPETALEIGHALGTSAELWLNLQATYKLHQARQETDLTDVQRRARLRDIVPIRELRNRGWIPDTDDLNVTEAAVCDLLGIGGLDEVPTITVAARRSNTDTRLTPEQTAWIARVSQVANRATVPEFDPTALAGLAEALPSRLREPDEIRNLTGWLSDCGVKLVVELPLRSSKLDGAVVFSADGPVIGLSTRGNRFDGFVFTLLHEIAHLVLEHVTEGSVRVDEDYVGTPTEDALETEANELAGSWIFPGGLEVSDPITTSKILEASRHHDVHPSLVIGRLQWNGRLEWAQYRNRIPRVRHLLPTLREAP